MRQRETLMIAGIALLILPLAAGCGAGRPTATVASPTVAPAATVANPAGLGPLETVAAFYRWYLAYSAGSVRHNPLADGAYRETGYVTDRWQAQVAAIRNSPGGGFDPFLCAQDVPEHVVPVRIEEADGRATVAVRTSFEGHAFAVVLVQEGEVWKIDGVSCDDRAAAATAAPSATAVMAPVGDGEQEYVSDEFGFRLRYPDGWTVREAQSREGEPPIGPESLRLVVLLMPAAWAQEMDRPGPPDPDAPVIAPISLEVVLAPQEEFWASYAEPARREEVQLAQVPALYTVEEVTEDINIPRYIFTHPVASDLRVVLTDPVSGFADRLAAYPEVAAAFRQVADSFAWLD